MRGERRRWRMAKTGERRGSAPAVLSPNCLVREYQWTERATAVVAMELGEVRGGMAIVAEGGAAEELDTGDVAVGVGWVVVGKVSGEQGGASDGV